MPARPSSAYAASVGQGVWSVGRCIPDGHALRGGLGCSDRHAANTVSVVSLPGHDVLCPDTSPAARDETAACPGRVLGLPVVLPAAMVRACPYLPGFAVRGALPVDPGPGPPTAHFALCLPSCLLCLRRRLQPGLHPEWVPKVVRRPADPLQCPSEIAPASLRAC